MTMTVMITWHGLFRLSAQAGCRTFIIHARKAWLQGLSRTTKPVGPAFAI